MRRTDRLLVTVAAAWLATTQYGYVRGWRDATKVHKDLDELVRRQRDREQLRARLDRKARRA